MTRVYGPRYPDGARTPTVPPDVGGFVHYGAGLKGSLCGVEDPARKETRSTWIGVTCPACKKQGNRRIP